MDGFIVLESYWIIIGLHQLLLFFKYIRKFFKHPDSMEIYE